jgi:hypothetical protein
MASEYLNQPEGGIKCKSEDCKWVDVCSERVGIMRGNIEPEFEVVVGSVDYWNQPAVNYKHVFCRTHIKG